jgi:MOSC domain-containing protein YiiM
MNARATALFARTPERWALTGDQLHVDFDIGFAHLLAGDRLRVGDAVIEVTPKLHSGCAKFRGRFGADAMRFVSSPAGRAVRARGLNAVVVTGGAVRRGDPVTKLLPSA